jgi:hypothetical protein
VDVVSLYHIVPVRGTKMTITEYKIQRFSSPGIGKLYYLWIQ